MKIHLHDMVFFGYHGVHPEEQRLGQRFIVNLTFYTADTLDQEIKSLEDTVDYTRVWAEIRNIMENARFLLLEECANTILDTLLASFDRITGVIIRIRKPGVPIKGSLESVEVEMERHR